ncbi:hypothetical protein H2O64_06540 [Kordia sp. YSTF-M3]|uniref:Uncharacterized protein n=1 Tax=Kordia aestuariivivens TaxID=2759037 RepID=A0ABR7Q6X8_9FLAO|nr:hypothetical protein [Kordia aestuariivivens]MBC8754322.1 hypothetical protein [Kordia aestuariivivens]
MKNLLKLSLIIAVALFTFSCSNDNTDVIPEDQSTDGNVALKTSLTAYARTAASTDQAETVFENNNENSDVIDNYSTDDCFTLNFPYTVTNGNTTAVVNSQAEADNFFNAGYYVAFPVTITTADGNIVTIANEFGFIQALEACLGQQIIFFGNDCFDFNFPLSVITDDGTTVVVNDNLELFSVNDAIGFVYPIMVTSNIGITSTINNDADFDALYNDCYDIDPCDDCGVNCFEIVYPLSLLSDDGTVTTINSDEEFVAFLDGIDNDTFFVPTYPMTIEYDDGTQATINSDDEFIAALDACS